METGGLIPWWPQTPLAFLGAVLGAMVLMYCGRQAAHGAIRALTGALRELFERSGAALMGAQERLVARNQEVLLQFGSEQTERLIEREFHRVNAVVSRDLAGYPSLNRRIADQIQRIDEDYRESTDVPPAPPEWTRAVETIASLPQNGDPVVGRILGDIHKTLTRAEKGAIDSYRKASGARHLLLKRMLPFWRRLTQILEKVDGTIGGLAERAKVIDQHMDSYEQIRDKEDRAQRQLSASSMTHFISSGFVLVIAVLGGFVNFQLIALPMSEMVGATSYVGPVATSDIAALVIILTEIAMGLFLMESLRITRMFPTIYTMDDQMRRRMIWVSGGILLTLACVESSLAYMRDILAADREALTQSLAGVEVAEATLRWIPSIGQMVMGFMLPFALAFAAIPLESFIHTSRVVFGDMMAFLMRLVGTVLDLIGNFVFAMGKLLVHVYDFLIVVPLWIEQTLGHRGARKTEREKSPAGGPEKQPAKG